MLAPNPEMVQPEDWNNQDKTSHTTPVFLIHDGGGTTFAYHCLDPLDRYVYGIHNPYFRTGQVFDGGLPQMARLYSAWIKQTVAKRSFPVKRKNVDGSINILLGGWSLGGFLSMEVARQLAEDRLVRVVGILMVDSMFPGRVKEIPWEDIDAAQDKARQHFYEIEDEDVEEERSLSTKARENNQVLSQRCMAEATKMVAKWKLPEWTGKLHGKRPKAILLRATQNMPTVSGGVVSLDMDREDKMLGWAEYDKDMFEQVIDVAGHHFDLFAPDRVDNTCQAIKQGLDKLDRLAQLAVNDFV
ncbi:putative thioesterase BOA10-like protein [Cladobotryum mycophilum]|uniref:Thioesterase BOA10-like protein n=1 Tax=Cladobotryum mycophilum TaxID=491253 RepID=A0ABR0SUY6_9HYPO